MKSFYLVFLYSISILSHTRNSHPSTLSTLAQITSGNLPGNCDEALPANVSQGQFLIRLPGIKMDPFIVLCLRHRNEVGTLIALNTKDQSENFKHAWKEYRLGFGKPNYRTNYFMGLERLHAITASAHVTYKLYVTLHTGGKCLALTKFDNFEIAGEKEKYTLSLGKTLAAGAAGALRYHNNMKFSTIDEDNDGIRRVSCAAKYRSGWWFGGHNCLECNLFGPVDGYGRHGLFCKGDSPLKLRKAEMFLVKNYDVIK